MSNQLLLTACIAEIGTLRYTPAGCPALELTLEHESEATEAGSNRQVKLALKAIALGPLAETLGAQTLGSQSQFSGFLGNRRNSKAIVFHIQEFRPVN